MANEYLKPQIPLKDLNSENYFYPLTTLDQIIIGNSRLSAYFSEDNGKLIFNNIDEDSVGGSIKLDGITTNRTLFVENDSLLSSENIFINNDSLAINTTSITSGYNFEVNGNSLFNGLLKINTNGNTVTIGSANTSWCHFENSANIPFYFNHQIQVNGNYKIYNNNTTYNAGWIELSGGTPYIDFYFNNSTADYTSRIIENASGRLYIPGKLAIGYTNDSYSLATASFICNGSSYFNGDTTHNGNISFTNSGTGFRGINYGTMGDNDQWRIGGAATGSNAGYMEIATADDGNEPIYVRQYTGVFTTLTRTATLLDGSGNTSFPGRIFADSYSTSSGYINGKATNGGINQILIGDNAWLGDCNIGGTLGIKSYSGSEAGISFYGNDGSGKGRIYYNGTGHSTVGLYGAVWNDYAEFRKSDTQEPGYVIAPAEDGIAYKTSVRMQAGARIISDTFGFAVGECDDAKTPVGLVGRVLAYTYQKRSNYKIGDAVCAAPNGTIDIMTREEIQKYPDRIIGIVNEIPDYEIWKSILTHSNGEQTIKEIEVKDRIWIDIK